MKQLLHYLTALCFAMCSLASYGQKTTVKKADTEFDGLSYVDARDLYLRVAEKGFTTPELLMKLGDSYYFTADYKEAVKWYGQLVKEGEDVKPEYYFRYAQSLKSEGKYAESDQVMTTFHSLNGNDSRGEMFAKERDYIKEIEAQSGRYEVGEVNFNTELQDFSPSFYGESVVFSSNRKTSTGKFTHSWNDQPFLDLYIAEDPKSGTPKVSKLDKKLNTPYHESSSVFTADGNEVYFTRNNYTSKKLGRSEDGTAKLKLYHSVKDGDGWSKPEELPFNNDQYSTAHPALSPDESILYFASDMPGTKGLSDIWMVAINGNNTFSSPVNLGDKINTEGRETFPFVTAENKIFFASDGHLGLGGLDVFIAQLAESGGQEGDAFNVGKPVNSTADDFGLILSEELGTGYFASNRDSGDGNDDIYSFVRKEKLIIKCIQAITGITRDVKSKAILPSTTVTLRDSNNEVVGTTSSDAQGRYSFADVDCGKRYAVRGDKEAYESSEELFTSGTESNGSTNQDLYLKPVPKVVVGEDLAKTLELNPIYFDFDKSNIRPDAAYELEKVIAVMKQYPALKIDVRSHTDSRAPDDYNISLSQRRNVSTIAYIVNEGGIDKSRLTGRGYGETQLVNNCSNGVPCSVEAHQLNRRSEFIIVSK